MEHHQQENHLCNPQENMDQVKCRFCYE